MNNRPCADEELFARFSGRGDHAALEELVARWHGAAFRVARCICRNSAMAEEAVQDTFVRLLSGKVRFQDRGPGSFRCWFLSLVTNSARMARRTERRQERKRNLSAREYALRKGCETGAEPAPGRSEWAAALGHALDGLEERSRTPVVLRFMEGMQQREMAALLGVSQQMVARRIDQGVAQLRLRLAGYGV